MALSDMEDGFVSYINTKVPTNKLSRIPQYIWGLTPTPSWVLIFSFCGWGNGRFIEEAGEI